MIDLCFNYTIKYTDLKKYQLFLRGLIGICSYYYSTIQLIFGNFNFFKSFKCIVASDKLVAFGLR